MAKTLLGTTVKLDSTTYSNIYEITPPSVTSERINVSNLGTTGGVNEYISPDLKDAGSFSFTTDYDGTAISAFTSAQIIFGGISGTLSFPASLQSDTPAAVAPNGIAKRTISVYINGAITHS